MRSTRSRSTGGRPATSWVGSTRSSTSWRTSLPALRRTKTSPHTAPHSKTATAPPSSATRSPTPPASARPSQLATRRRPVNRAPGDHRGEQAILLVIGRVFGHDGHGLLAWIANSLAYLGIQEVRARYHRAEQIKS